MKTGLLTHPLACNYGGLMQAYALRKALMDLGHEVVVINRWIDTANTSGLTLVKHKLIDLARKALGRKPLVDDSATAAFHASMSPVTERMYHTDKMHKFAVISDCKAYVVGSDQVWRQRYVKPIEDFFLAFTKGLDVKRIAYGASFGVDKWEISPETTRRCANLAQKFDDISVREDSGIKLCADYLGVEAVQVCDPVFLHPASHYRQHFLSHIAATQTGKAGISQESQGHESQDYVFTHIFESSELSEQIMSWLYSKDNVILRNAYPDVQKFCIWKRERIKPISNWLGGIADATLVVTDSFHVCAFSLIFHTPFIAIGNPERGNARIESLLRMFGLEERMVGNANPALLEKLANKKIDWEKVDSIIADYRQKGYNFLRENLH